MRAHEVPTEIEQPGAGGVQEQMQRFASIRAPLVGERVGPDARGREIVRPRDKLVQLLDDRRRLPGFFDQRAADRRQARGSAIRQFRLLRELRRAQAAQRELVIAAKHPLRDLAGLVAD